MKLFEAQDLTDLERERARHYFEIENKMRVFEISCTEEIFIKMFGKDEGIRLRDHFVRSCDGKIAKWLTYLQAEQKELFLTQVIKYQNLAKEIL